MALYLITLHTLSKAFVLRFLIFLLTITHLYNPPPLIHHITFLISPIISPSSYHPSYHLPHITHHILIPSVNPFHYFSQLLHTICSGITSNPSFSNILSHPFIPITYHTTFLPSPITLPLSLPIILLLPAPITLLPFQSPSIQRVEVLTGEWLGRRSGAESLLMWKVSCFLWLGAVMPMAVKSCGRVVNVFAKGLFALSVSLTFLFTIFIIMIVSIIVIVLVVVFQKSKFFYFVFCFFYSCCFGICLHIYLAGTVYSSARTSVWFNKV